MIGRQRPIQRSSACLLSAMQIGSPRLPPGPLSNSEEIHSQMSFTYFIPPTDRRKRIARLGVPIVLGSISYSVFSLVDMAMVGTLGSDALAAVGLSGFAYFVYFSLFWGSSVAVQAMASRRLGEGRDQDAGDGLGAALLLISVIAPITSVPLLYYTPEIFSWLNDDPNVISASVPYVRWLIASALTAGASNAFSGFWIGTDQAAVQLRTVVVSQIANIVLNYAFIFGTLGAPEMGVEGAGVGTALSSVIMLGYNIVLGFRFGRPYGFLRHWPKMETIKSLVKLVTPTSGQFVLDAIGLTLMYKIVGLVSTEAMAAYSVVVRFIDLTGLPAWALGSAGATLVGQALGRKDPDDASRWAWDVIKLGVFAMFILGMPLWVAPELILSAFIHDQVTLDLALWPARILGIMISINGVGYMLASMLNGAGDVRRVMYVNMATQYLLLLPLAWLMGPYLGYGLIGVWCIHQFAYRALQSGIFSAMWVRGRWAGIDV